MRIDYGTPGHRGVTHLMAVGDSEYSDPAVLEVVKRGGMVAGAAVLAGWLLGAGRVTNMGLGAVAALVAVHMAATGQRKVPVAGP